MAERYTDWSHVRVVGDQSVAEQHLPDARRLLGEVFEQAAVNQLGTYSLRRQQADGTLVVAEKHGDIPRITIVTGQGEQGTQQTYGGDFVVWPRNEDLPDGLDDEFPQVILRANEGWTPFYYDGSAAEAAGRPDAGTYIGRFADGIPHGGNVDWRGPGGLVLSWYGPSTRYWVDPYVQPQEQFGKHVFMLGQVLLDVEAYQEGEDVPFAAQWVMGAALAGLKLYVMHADLPLGFTTTTPPTGTIGQIVYQVDPWFVVTGIPHLLCRYSLVPDPGRPGFYRVDGGSREVLWTGAPQTGAMPWFFNPNADRAHCFGMSPGTLGGVEITTYSSLGGNNPPAVASPVFRVMRNGDAVTMTTTSVSVPPNGVAAVAGDYDDDGNVVEVTIERQQRAPAINPVVGASLRTDHWLMKCGGASVDLFDLAWATTDLGSNSPSWYFNTTRYVLHADARSGLLVVALERIGLQFDITAREVRWEIYSNGEKIHDELVSDAPAAEATGMARGFPLQDAILSAWKTYDVSPMFSLYGFSEWTLVGGSGYGFQQAHGGHLILPYQASRYFGAYDVQRIVASGNTPPPPVSTRCSVTPERERLDKDGHDSVFGAAARAGDVIVSSYSFKQAGLDSPGFISNTTLPTVTGVSGEQARFHPVWLLGKPAQTV